MLNKLSTLESIGEKKIKEILVNLNYIDTSDLRKADEQSKKNKTSFLEYFYANELLTPEIVGQAIAESFNIEYIDLGVNPPTQEQIERIPETIAKQYRIVLVSETNELVTIATDNPVQKELPQDVKKLFNGQKINLGFCLSEQLEKAFVKYKKSLEARFVKIINEQRGVAPGILNEIIEDALAYKASDIHFEPQEEEVVIRFRIDGVLHEVGRIPTEHYNHILNRTKVQSKLRIDEHFTPQDGAIRYEKDGQSLDLRISIAPTLSGEKIVIRVLSSYVQNFTLSDLGLTHTNQQLFSQSAIKPFGMILITGPTGSGKTTSLYALLKSINRPEINITTIEDPIEYRLARTNQIQVDNQNVTFAKGLRSIVRQDPDVILVGEIRDNETAEIAVNIALTGHLLVSTFHSNDAATTVPRLLDMNIEPFLLASTLELVVSQRLIRTLCQSCRYSQTVSVKDLEKILPKASKWFSQKTTIYLSKGCKACSETGFSGRTGIFEIIRSTKELRDLILENPSTKQISDLASKQGTNSLFEDGIKKVKSGLTTLEELLRIVSPPED